MASNFTSMDNGVCVVKIDDDMIIFDSKNPGKERIVNCEDLPDGKLHSIERKIFLIDKDQVFSLGLS